MRQSKENSAKDNRAWIEINREALRHNARVLQEVLPKPSKLMAVVKANAYGHGDIEVSRTLMNCGIDAFAVATLSEGIHLRKNGIRGEILILGYTHPKDRGCLVRYKLTQTIINCDYAKALNAMGKTIQVHIKVDTGMHRLGVGSEQTIEIEDVFKCENLIVKGMYTHLCVADSLREEDISYTKLQTGRFFQTIAVLQQRGYATGKIHVQSSYGILNYPEFACDYARAGIALYGVLSNRNETCIKVDLQPVLSIKARVAMVRQIEAQESVSYGRLFTAQADMKIATISIGYADGIPRNLFESKGYVLLHSKKAPIIGRICMDQFVIDVSDIEAVKPNDIVTIIGGDGSEQIHCEDFAEKCGTISNEILSRLSNRLEYVIG